LFAVALFFSIPGDIVPILRPYNEETVSFRVYCKKRGFMKERISLPASLMRRGAIAALVLGTALTAVGRAPAQPQAAEATLRAVGDISRYCTACWRNARLHPDSWTDCTQDVFSRLMERVDPNAWGSILRDESDERRELLRAIDAVKKRSQRSRKLATMVDDAGADRHDSAARQRADDRQVVDAAAADLLSERQQRILRLSFEGWSVHDIAAEMKIGPDRVSDEKYKAIRKLREHLCAEEVG
jgi:RNA polymerase sigma factor (sigma-70 family)